MTNEQLNILSNLILKNIEAQIEVVNNLTNKFKI